MFRFFPLCAVAAALAGCGAPGAQIASRQDFLAEATRSYPKEHKDRVFQAAEAILNQSDPGSVDIQYTSGGFVARRKFNVFAVLAAEHGEEKWDFGVDDRADAATATLSISEAGTTVAGSSVSSFDRPMKSVLLYRLFWKRMDYMLGRRTDWASCADETKALEQAGTNVHVLGGLCGPTSAGASAPPPAPLPPLAAAKAPPKAL